jgi:hypothetical protein
MRNRVRFPSAILIGFVIVSVITVARTAAARSLNQSGDRFSAVGRVIDAATGQPLPGVRIVFGQPGSNTNNGGFIDFQIAKTNPAGEFQVNGLKPGHYTIYISASLDRSDLYSDPIFFDIVDTDVANLEVPARHGSRLSGLIMPAGVTNPEALAGLPSVKVVAAAPSLGTLRVGITSVSAIRPDGSFQLSGLRPGKIFLNLKADSEKLNGLSILRIESKGAELKQGFELKAGEDLDDLRLTIADGTGVIHGQVKVEGGTLPPGSRMLASIRNPLLFANGYAEVDEHGGFSISGLAAGTYEITLNVYNPPPRQATRLLPTMKETVKVTDANEAEAIFTINLTGGS